METNHPFTRLHTLSRSANSSDCVLFQVKCSPRLRLHFKKCSDVFNKETNGNVRMVGVLLKGCRWSRWSRWSSRRRSVSSCSPVQWFFYSSALQVLCSFSTDSSAGAVEMFRAETEACSQKVRGQRGDVGHRHREFSYRTTSHTKTLSSSFHSEKPQTRRREDVKNMSDVVGKEQVFVLFFKSNKSE